MDKLSTSETIGNNLPFVSLVYIGALLPWGFFYIHDFISGRWSSIRSTIRAGAIHIFAILLPMPLIVTYIVFQETASDPDHKEMYAALIALALSAYHLARTIWGIRQLLLFRQWALNTALAMERAAYRCAPRPVHHVTQLPQFARRPSSFSSQPTSVQPPSSSTLPPPYSKKIQPFSWFRRRKHLQQYYPYDSSDPILPTVVTEQRCSFFSLFELPRNFASSRFRRRFSSETISGVKNLAPINMDRVYKNLSSIPKPNIRCLTHDPSPISSTSTSSIPLDNNASSIDDKRYAEIKDLISSMKVNSSILDNEFIGSEAPRTRLFTTSFINPHDAFVRWSICYLAQFGSAWLKASRARLFDQHSWDGRRYNLASEVWATAALRMETTCFHAQRGPKSPGIPRGNSTQVSFLSPALWHFFLPGQSDHVFSMGNLLRNCMLTGEGFPYGKPIIEETEAKPSLGMYRGLIKDVLADLNASLYDVVDGITPEQLHWFAIFVWIGQWNGCGKSDETLTNLNSGFETYTNNTNPGSLFSLDDSGEEALKPTHAPIMTLQDQLGFDDEVTLDRCSFPFVRQRYGKYLWKNRSVLQVSGRIDNWLSLRIGHHFFKLFKQYASFGEDTKAFKHAHAMVQDEKDNAGEIIVDNKGDDDVGRTDDERPRTGLNSNERESSMETGKYRQSQQPESGPSSTQQSQLLPGASTAQPEPGSSSTHQLRLPPHPKSVLGSKHQISLQARQQQSQPLSRGAKNSSNDCRSNSAKRSDRIFNFHRRFEINRLRYQLARIDVPLLHLDQGITFMGCAMETVRSYLAEDVRRHVDISSSPSPSSPTPPLALASASPLTPDSLWSPRLSPDGCAPFPISAQLVDCLRVLEPDSDDRFDPTVQERLLWECQNALVLKLDEVFSLDEDNSHDKNHSGSTVRIRAPHRLELIMLAILSFPGLRLTRVHHPHPQAEEVVVQLEPMPEITPQSEQQTQSKPSTSSLPTPQLQDGKVGYIEGGLTTAASSTATQTTSMNTTSTILKPKKKKQLPQLRKDALSFIIEAPAAPQKVSLSVDASATLQEARIHLSYDSNETHFQWQDWRDAFLGRLSGKADWQRTHFMRNLHVNRTDAPITSLFRNIKVGEERSIPLWVGWEPFRARIRKFELQHSSLIIVGQIMPPDTAFSRDASSDSDAADADFDDAHKFMHTISRFNTATGATGQPEETNRTESQPPGINSVVREMGGVAGISDEGNDGNGEGAELQGNNGGGVVETFPYFQAKANALSDASMHVDSVLRLNSTLLDGPTGRDLKESSYIDQHMAFIDYERGFEMDSPRKSSDGSSGDVPVAMLFSRSGRQPDALLNLVNAQDPKAMAILATDLLEGRPPFRRDRNRAIALMERSITIGKDIRTANLFIKTLLDPSANSGNARSPGRYSPSNDRKFNGSILEADDESIVLSDRNEGVGRALAIVDLLWRDMPTRCHQKRDENGVKILKSKRSTSASEERRMRKLVDLHLKVIQVRRTADVMCDLGNQLSIWGTSKRDESMAITLYESAIIADCDVWAMAGLALKYIDRDSVYAKKLFTRAVRENWSGLVAEVGEDTAKMVADRKNDVHEHMRRLRDNGDARAAKLLHGTL